jgi:UDP-glucose 4-epimerase
MAILVTGGLGYIGSHTVVQLLLAGHKVVILDNLCNSKPEVVKRISSIANTTPQWLEGDVRDRALLAQLFSNQPIVAVIHFAGLKSVVECGVKPLVYYENNVGGSITLLDEMAKAGVNTFLFSSSATVYGEPVFLPYTEEHPLQPINVYGYTKLMVEQIADDFARADPKRRVAILRYFNPVGAHISGMIGEDPNGVPNNLMPLITQVAVGKRERLTVFGNDYATVDGTGVRDYIHVDDLASGHLAALNYLKNHGGTIKVNLGTGKGTSVLQLVHAFEKTSGKPIPYVIAPRRAGDLPEYFAEANYAKTLLGWSAQFDIDRMCADSWRWQSQNPNGYDS